MTRSRTARAALIKDERHLDAFDRVFSKVFKGLAGDGAELIDLTTQIPEDWLKKLNEKFLTDEEKAQIEAMGGWEKLMETLKKRLEEQQKRHQGGSKWIGTAGTSPFGAYGYNPEGVRIGQEKNRNNRAVKVWDKREFKDLDGNVELGIRNIKIALRRLRKFARTGAPEELDLDDKDLAPLRKVRDALFAEVSNRSHGIPADLSSLAPHAASANIEIAKDGTVSLLARGRGWRKVLSWLLLEVYRSQQDNTWQRLKACKNTKCRGVFYDASTNNSGAWHDVRTCGNIANLRASRARKRLQTHEI